MNNIVGYIASDALGGSYIPHQVQNLTIRNFLIGRKKNFLLSWTEYKGLAPQVYNSLLLEKFYDGICFYSIEQIVQFDQSFEVLKDLKKKNIWIGFARENLFFKADDGFDACQKMCWLLKSISTNTEVQI